MKLKITAIVLLFLLSAGCRSLRETSPAPTAPLPEKWGAAQDTVNATLLTWRKYFNDTQLLALIDEGIKNNPDVLIALQRTGAAEANLRFSKSALLPTVSANAAYLQRKFGLYTMDGAGNISTDITPGQRVPIHLPDYYLGLQTSWEADVWGRLRSKKRAATARYLAEKEGRNLAVTLLVARIAGAYYELLALDNQLDLVQKTITLQQEALALVTLQKQAAAANELAVMQFEAQLLNSGAIAYELRQRVVENEALINFLLGRYPQPVARDRSSFNAQVLPALNAGIPSDLLRNRPDIRQSELELLAAKADLKAARAAFYPSLVLQGNGGFQAFQTAFWFRSPESVAYALLANATAPLLNRGAIKAAFRTADAAQLQAFYNYNKSILNGYMEVNNGLWRMKNLDSLVDLRTRQVNALRRSVEVASDLFKTNRANYLEVLMTQRNALDTELELLDARRRRYNAAIDLYKALGGGWE